jgi:hypothetical protein
MRRTAAMLTALPTILGACSLIFGIDGAGYVGPGRAPTESQDASASDSASSASDAASTSSPEAAAPLPYVSEVLRDAPVLYLRLDDPTLPADPDAPQVYDEISKTYRGVRVGSLDAGVTGALGSGGGTALEFDTGFLSFGDRLAFAAPQPSPSRCGSARRARPSPT